MPLRWPRGRTSRRAARRRGADLEHDLPEEEDERPRDVEAVGEERAVAGVRLLLLGDAADGEDHLVRLAGQEVAAARAAVRQQADAGRPLALDLRAVVRPRARDDPAGRLVHPAEGRDVVVRAEQDAGLAGPGLRREVGLPFRQLVSLARPPSAPCSARCRRASPGAGPAARGRRSRGRRCPACPCASRHPVASRFAERPAACRCRRRSSRRRPSSTTLTAAATSAASNAQPKSSTEIASGLISAAS